MPRYYFYLSETAAPPHITGAVFQDAAAAKEFGKRLRTALTDRAACAKAHWSVAVTDENGSVITNPPADRLVQAGTPLEAVCSSCITAATQQKGIVPKTAEEWHEVLAD